VTVSIHFDPPVIAHRGASAYAPENTMLAFTKAALLGIKWVEFDVVLAACGTPVIFHDETLERTSNGRGRIGNYAYTYLQTLDAGSWFAPGSAGERIPTLAELAAFLLEKNMKANVEIKPLPGQEEKTVVNTLRVLAPFFSEDSSSILFSSFSLPTLKILRAKAPYCHMGLLMHEWIDDWRQHANLLSCVSVHVNNDILTSDRAKQIKSADKLLLSYTVNDAHRASELFSWGVDAVFSDYPNKLLSKSMIF
jgi:glycerophosphoryl diester phosphodiesterase